VVNFERDMRHTFRPSLYQRSIGPVSLLISVILLIVLLTKWEIDEPNEIYWVIGMFVFFLIGGLYLTAELLFFQVVVSESALSAKYIVRADKRLAWSEIESVDISMKAGIITVNGKRDKIQLPKGMTNADKLLQLIVSKVGKDKVNNTK